MTDTLTTKPPIVDRTFAEKYLWAVDRPLEYSVYRLLPEWWETAPQGAIDDYATLLANLEGAPEFLAERYLSEPFDIEDLRSCPEGSLGASYYSFIVDNGLDANLLVNFRTTHQEQLASGILDRVPEDLSYIGVRLSQIHDFAHTIAGFGPDPAGEIKMAAFHLAQLRFPYHSMRLAVTSSHIAFVSPRYVEPLMDAMSIGWMMGRKAKNIHLVRWEDHLDTPIEDIRAEYGIDRSIDDNFATA